MLRRTLIAIALVALPGALAAQDSGYKRPPSPIAEILDAPPTPFALPSPDRQWLLLVELTGSPSIAEVTAPYLALAGRRIDPRTNGPHLPFRMAKGLKLVRIGGPGGERAVEVPTSSRIGDVQWSPDGAHISFTVTSDAGIALHVADVTSGRSRRLTEPKLNATGNFLGRGCSWAARDRLVCFMVPDGRGAAPRTDAAPTGPSVQETREGSRSAIWTYQNLLRGPADELAFEHYFTSQIAIVDTSGRVTPIGRPAIYTEATPSPSGEYLFVGTVHRPYSYLVDLSSFPIRTEIWSMDGRVVRQLADRPLQEVANNFDYAQLGPRSATWRADVPATLVWTEAIDGGNPKREASKRDRVHMLAAPFTGSPQTLIELGYRYAGTQWTKTGLAMVSEGWQSTRRTRTWIVDTKSPSAAPRLLVDRSSEDRYADPGFFVPAPGGTPGLIATSADGKFAYRTGAGASPEGDRPFFDRVTLTSATSERLWRSAAPYYEEVVALLDEGATQLITRREATEEPPNYHVRALRGGTLTKLTNFTDPAPQLAGITKQLVSYKRADGVGLTATLYLPRGYDKQRDGPLPFFLWAYPTEFKDAAAAAQMRGSPYRFTRPSPQTGTDHLLLLTQGYGVLDNPTMPIVGEGETEPNDTYVEQLVASAKAAIDHVASLGVADRERVGIGGHSYGAFMTANLLAHSRLFRAGVARSGAFNRTLTPFGFQRESRSFWQAEDVYLRMSPFMYADSIADPILFIHGGADSNPGTFTIQSERMYAAVKGNGGRARLVLLPGEDHGYSARESIAHVMWETVTWLDEHVKRSPRRTVQD